MQVIKEDLRYKCDTCGKRFNWDNNSWRFGKAEYKTITEQKAHEKTFCSDECVEKFKELENDK